LDVPRKPTPTFIHELPLRIDRAQAHALDKRFGVVHFAYNATLQEMLARLDRMRTDPNWTLTRGMPKISQQQRAERAAAFKELRQTHGFSEFAAHMRASGYLDALIDSHTAQTLASRAFKACNAYALGGRGRPRFKRRADISSVEGKGPTSPLNWRDDRVVWGSRRRDRAMVLRPLFDERDRDGVQSHALAGRVKYVRLVRRTIQGQVRYFAQLVCEGRPLQRFEPKQGVAAIDLGPCTAAIVSPERAALVSLLPEIAEDLKAKRRLQRAMDRSIRATNAQCFNADGTYKPGARVSVRSAHYLQLRAALAEQQRVMAQARERALGRVSNIVLREFGNVVRTEKLSRKAWQKTWGRRMSATAPGMFIRQVARKAENAGGAMEEFSAGKYRLSQYDHTQQDFIKKPLSLRLHVVRDGSGHVVQRDLYSAWLALFISANGLDASHARKAWAVAYPLLAHAAANPVKAASWRSMIDTRRLKDVGAARMQERRERTARSAPVALAAEESCVRP
jgi:putative transposase